MGAALEIMETAPRLRSTYKIFQKCQYAETNISSSTDKEAKLEEKYTVLLLKVSKFKLIQGLLKVSV